MALMTMRFESKYLEGNTRISVILPDKPRETPPTDFYRRSKKYPVLWLLHGGSGDNTDWIRKSRIEMYACEHDLMVVMPSAMNSAYLDWPGFFNGYAFEAYFFKELMPMIQNWFPASKEKEKNYVGGLAMGGRGAVQFALLHPERFGAVINLSAAIPDYEEEDDRLSPKLRERKDRLLVNYGSRQALLESPANVRGMIHRIADEGRIGEIPPMYFACGTEDHNYPDFLETCVFCREAGLRITENYAPGGHEWEYWDKEIEKAMVFLGFDSGEEMGNLF